MRRLIAVASLCLASFAFGADQPASEASIREILRLTEAQKLVDGMFTQVEAMMKQSMDQGFAGLPLSAEERVQAKEMADRMTTKMMALMRDELKWSKLEPMYIQIYQKSFTQEEVDGMVEFYKSRAGMALIKKMPTVMQESMGAMQQFMGPMMQKIGEAVQETVEEMKTKARGRN